LYRKAILEARFCHDNESISRQNLDGIRAQIFGPFLNYLYTDHLICPPHLLMALAKLATNFGISRLALLCRQTYVSEDNPSAIAKIPDSIFAQEMLTMVNDSRFSDLSLVVQGNPFYTHRAILASRCDYFKCLLEGGFSESNQKKLIIDETINSEIFEAAIQFLYTGDQSIISPDTVLEILAAADRFLLDELHQICEFFVLESVDLENVSWLLQFADSHHAQRLRRYCLEYICSDNRWVQLRQTEAFNQLREESPQIVREIDYLLSEVHKVAKPGELIRYRPVKPTVIQELK